MKKKNVRQPTLSGEILELRPISVAYVSRSYVAWLNDPKVNQYLESRFTRSTIAGVRKYVKNILKDKDIYFFAIIAQDGTHIGNIKLGPIDQHHKLAAIGLMIGDKQYWGRGYATEAIRLITHFAFKNLKLHKVTAGTYTNNLGSIKAFLKEGFYQEGVERKHYRYGKDYVDGVLMAKISSSGR